MLIDVEEILSCPAGTASTLLNFYQTLCSGKEIEAIEILKKELTSTQRLTVIKDCYLLHRVSGNQPLDWSLGSHACSGLVMLIRMLMCSYTEHNSGEGKSLWC